MHHKRLLGTRHQLYRQFGNDELCTRGQNHFGRDAVKRHAIRHGNGDCAALAFGYLTFLPIYCKGEYVCLGREGLCEVITVVIHMVCLARTAAFKEPEIPFERVATLFGSHTVGLRFGYNVFEAAGPGELIHPLGNYVGLSVAKARVGIRVNAACAQRAYYLGRGFAVGKAAVCECKVRIHGLGNALYAFLYKALYLIAIHGVVNIRRYGIHVHCAHVHLCTGYKLAAACYPAEYTVP